MSNHFDPFSKVKKVKEIKQVPKVQPTSQKEPQKDTKVISLQLDITSFSPFLQPIIESQCSQVSPTFSNIGIIYRYIESLSHMESRFSLFECNYPEILLCCKQSINEPLNEQLNIITLVCCYHPEERIHLFLCYSVHDSLRITTQISYPFLEQIQTILLQTNEVQQIQQQYKLKVERDKKEKEKIRIEMEIGKLRQQLLFLS